MHVIFVVLGFLAAALLFGGGRFLPQGKAKGAPRVSVIIPMRNEAHNMPALLESLNSQTLKPHEVLCVDDMSTDGSAEVCEKAGARVLRVGKKPAGWAGKSYACQLGAKTATGNVLVFLDADVRCVPDTLDSLVAQLQDGGGAVSVQPWHSTKRPYEQLALLFNLVSAAALTGLGTRKTKGLFGPVIAINREDYWCVNGHEAAKGDVVEDLALGRALQNAGVRCRRLMGGGLVSFRMYPQGVKDLYEGFTKNFATGAAGTPAFTFVLVALWVAALCRCALQLGQFIAMPLLVFHPLGWLYIALYVAMVVQLIWAGDRVGHFQLWALFLYPVPLAFFVVVFCVSLFKKVLGLPVKWKGRSMQAGG